MKKSYVGSNEYIPIYYVSELKYRGLLCSVFESLDRLFT